MEQPAAGIGHLVVSSRHFARRLLALGENRLELLMVEVQEGREHLLRAILLGCGAAAFGLLAVATLSVATVLLLWALSPVVVLLALTGLYSAAAGFLYLRLSRLLRNWQSLPATLNQLRKDSACLEQRLG